MPSHASLTHRPIVFSEIWAYIIALRATPVHPSFGAKTVQITDLTVPKLPQGTHWDTRTRGFGLRVGKSTRTFIVLVASGRRRTIGKYGPWSVADARTEAKRLLAEKALGKRFERRTAYEDALTSFLADSRHRNRPRTTADYTRLLHLHFPFGRKALSDISAHKIIERVNRLGNRPSEKHHAFTAARRFFRWCVQNHLLDRSPMENMQPPPTGKSRDRVLSEEEFRGVWHCALNGETQFHKIVALLILTGARKSEIARLKWSWITDTTIELPAEITKNGRKHSIPIGSSAIDILKGISRFQDNLYVFPAQRMSRETTTTFAGWGKPKTRFDDECGVTGWVLHDLRRCFAVGLQKLGTRLETIEVLLNHVSGSRAGIVGVYQRYGWEAEAREAMLRWEAFLATLLPPT